MEVIVMAVSSNHMLEGATLHDTRCNQWLASEFNFLSMTKYLVLFIHAAGLAFAGEVSYPVVGTGQTMCYDDWNKIPPPQSGQPFYGQDAQQKHPCPSYVLNHDGLTVRDSITGLDWQRSPDTNGDGRLDRSDKLTLAQAQALPAKLNVAKFGGFEDWRLPSIKELYSLFDARGTDPSGPSNADTSALTPFIDTKFFQFAYGDPGAGERVIDSQYASSTKYVGKGARGFEKLFGVNFADGRIKGYDLMMPGGGVQKTFFVQCVRGNPGYGRNDFHDNGDGTITDRATGLMWSKADSETGMNWREALAWVQKMNAENFLGHDDWRLPDVKELQSIVDYTRSPGTTESAAIDPVFQCTAITNEDGQADFPFYWSATTHRGLHGGGAAMYVAFGQAAGWMSPRARAGGPPPEGPGGPDFPQGPPPQQSRDASPYHFVDVHGAGAQRSDPKSGDPATFPHGRGPQGDVIRINNFVRVVRNTDAPMGVGSDGRQAEHAFGALVGGGLEPVLEPFGQIISQVADGGVHLVPGVGCTGRAAFLGMVGAGCLEHFAHLGCHRRWK